ncbi:MAG: glycine/betaine/sarcosine/D-proline family reductase selenoprotein B [Anaerolineae bacterium]|jgi:glycine reductase
MGQALRVAHYVNQFFGGIGGEDQADSPLEIRRQPVGPGQLLHRSLGDRGEVVLTWICGDNYFNRHSEAVLDEILQAVDLERIDAVVAGPAFNAGRYGMACGAVCERIARQRGLPVVTALFPENPAVESYRQIVPIIPTTRIASGTKAAIEQMVKVLLSSASEGGLGPATTEGYLPRGQRRNVFHARAGAARAVDMLVAKLGDQPFETELTIQGFEQVAPAPPLQDLSTARIAIVTEAGIVPVGNPDRLEWARATKWLQYSIEGLDDLTSETHEAIHGGFDNTWANEDPDRVLGVDVLREFEAEGFIGGLDDAYYVTMGNGGDLAVMKEFGREIAEILRGRGVEGAVLPST